MIKSYFDLPLAVAFCFGSVGGGERLFSSGVGFVCLLACLLQIRSCFVAQDVPDLSGFLAQNARISGLHHYT